MMPICQSQIFLTDSVRKVSLFNNATVITQIKGKTLKLIHKYFVDIENLPTQTFNEDDWEPNSSNR